MWSVRVWHVFRRARHELCNVCVLRHVARIFSIVAIFASSCFSFPLPCDGVHRRVPVSSMNKNGSSPALASALLSYIVAAKSQHAGCENLSFQFGPYGGKVQYSFQPRLDGIAHNYELMKRTVGLLAVEKRPTVVRATFLKTQKDYADSNLNNSSYPDSLWAGWCQTSVMLLTEHISRCAHSDTIYKKVVKDGKADHVEKLDELIKLLNGSRHVDVKVELDGDEDRLQTPVKTKKSTGGSSVSTASSISRFSSAGSTSMWSPRTDFEKWTGGTLMLQALASNIGIGNSITNEASAAIVEHGSGNSITDEAQTALAQARSKAAVSATPGARKASKKLKIAFAKEVAKRPAAAMKPIKKGKADKVPVKPESIMIEGMGRLSVIQKVNGEVYITSHFASNASGRERWATVTEKQAAKVGNTAMGVVGEVIKQIEAKKLNKVAANQLKKKLLKDTM